ncbi:hypothetical protein ILUMI_12402 [Ignelater luminosus]|uniref:Carboxylic ester hydrolase n=1 Tax=Ignelater luminosus TaxID=2038154 RepID=A0A8K0GCZ8_IGNLU|nr:hypothetical protein ILUMI_12402 [Ignelater luminosus]
MCNTIFQVSLFVILVCNLILLNNANELDREHNIVQTKYGKIEGNTLVSRNKRTFYAFRGIPYAAPPTGDLRFRAPIPPKPWSNVRDAKKDGPICIQKNYLYSEHPPVEGKEDCLYLNVYTPKDKNTSLLPVMVFIHQGGFFGGTGNSDYLGPHYFMDKDVVLVTFNYRLAVFGLLCTNDEASPGNYALKDQVFALEWVKENIRNFGGDNNQVTIFGESAGAGSVHLHFFSPTTEGLFHRAVSESGSSLSLWARPTNQLQELVAKQQASFVNCSINNGSHAMVECLRQVDAVTLADSADLFKYFSTEPYAVYGPVTEKISLLNPKPYLSKDPLFLLQEGKFHRIPWITGVVSDEGILRVSPLLRNSTTREELKKNFDVYGPQMLGIALSVPEGDVMTVWKNVTSYFLQADNVNVSNPDSVQGFINLYSDRSFKYGSYQSALLHAWKGLNDVWFYNFNYRGEYSYGDVYAATKENINFTWGVCHTDDLLYLFTSPKLFTPLKSKKDLQMSEIMIQMWTDFAIKGDPSPTIGGATFKWRPLPNLSGQAVVKNSDLVYLDISGNHKSHDKIAFEIKNDFLTEQMLFWESLPLAENIDGLQ